MNWRDTALKDRLERRNKNCTISQMRFVVLHHSGFGEDHFDLMLEMHDDCESLLTFRSAMWPIKAPTALQRIGNHRRAYLTYEGVLSGGRGQVRRVDAGDVVSLEEKARCYLLPAQKLRIQEDGLSWHAVPVGEDK